MLTIKHHILSQVEYLDSIPVELMSTSQKLELEVLRHLLVSYSGFKSELGEKLKNRQDSLAVTPERGIFGEELQEEIKQDIQSLKEKIELLWLNNKKPLIWQYPT